MPWRACAAKIAEKKDQIIEMQRALTAVPALGPQNGGTGEWEKAQVLVSLAGEARPGPCESTPAPDPRVPRGERPNVLVTIPGTSHGRRLLDHVPPRHRAARESRPCGSPTPTRSW